MNPLFFYTVAAGGQPKPEYGYTGVWLMSGAITVSSAWTMENTQVSSGLTQYVFDSGLALSNVVSSGAIQYISSGGTASGGIYDGRFACSSGGLVLNASSFHETPAVVESNAIHAGGVASRLILGGVGSGFRYMLAVAPGGRAVDVSAFAGAVIYINTGGEGSAFTLNSAGGSGSAIFGALLWVNGGHLSGCTINSRSVVSVISQGAIVEDLILTEPGAQVGCYSSAFVSNVTLLSSGVTLPINATASATAITVSGGTAIIRGNADTINLNGDKAYLWVSSGATATSVSMLSGGTATISSGGTAIDLTASNIPTVKCISGDNAFVSNLTLSCASAIFTSSILSGALIQGTGVGYSANLSCIAGSATDIVLSGGVIFSPNSGTSVGTVDIYSGCYFATNNQTTINRCICHHRSIVSAYNCTVDELVFSSDGGAFSMGSGCVITVITPIGPTKGALTVANGAVFSDRIVSGYTVTYGATGSGSNITVLDGAISIQNHLTNLTVGPKGTATVISQTTGAGVISGAVISGTNALANVSAGGSALAVSIISGGRINVWVDGYASGITNDAGTVVLYGGSAINVINYSGTFLIPAGAWVSSVTLAGSGLMQIVGSALDITVISSGANPHVSGYASGIAIRSSCKLQVFNGGTATAVAVLSGGSLIVSSGGSALAVDSQTGAVVTVIDGGYIEYA